MASGGYVPATPGGTLVRLGEGGQGEWVIPNSQMSLVGAGGPSVVLEFTGPVYATSPAQAKAAGAAIMDGAIKRLAQSKRNTTRGSGR